MFEKTAPTRTEWFGHGMTALCGGALALNLLFVVGTVGILAVNGLGHFWQQPLVQVHLSDGNTFLGEILDREPIPEQWDTSGEPAMRIRMKVGNRDLTGIEFRWIDERKVVSREEPRNVALLERREWGDFLGTPLEIRRGDERLASGPNAVWLALQPLLNTKKPLRTAVNRLEQREMGDVAYAIERLRLQRRSVERGLNGATPSPTTLARLDQDERQLRSQYDALERRLRGLRQELAAEVIVFEAADGTRTTVLAGDIERVVRPNALGQVERVKLYLSRVWEFVSADPRESNTEGGVFPAIFGTVMMVFVMSIAVTPLGVLAALYLREYSRQGFLIRLVRIAVNNLASVPSIVFGIFGLGFFVYTLGGTIDSLFYAEALPSPTWGTGGILWASLTLALLTVPVVIVATEEGLAAVPRSAREASMALGATQFETTWRVVLPGAAPGILTGIILAMARAAGEVAPLMIVGMVKLAPALPIDHHAPFIHLERKFMHLGFHIYDIGFQSPNVEAVKPLVFSTALLLLTLVTLMNLVAIIVRNHLRAKYATSAV